MTARHVHGEGRALSWKSQAVKAALAMDLMADRDEISNFLCQMHHLDEHSEFQPVFAIVLEFKRLRKQLT